VFWVLCLRLRSWRDFSCFLMRSVGVNRRSAACPVRRAGLFGTPVRWWRESPPSVAQRYHDCVSCSSSPHPRRQYRDTAHVPGGRRRRVSSSRSPRCALGAQFRLTGRAWTSLGLVLFLLPITIGMAHDKTLALPLWVNFRAANELQPRLDPSGQRLAIPYQSSARRRHPSRVDAHRPRDDEFMPWRPPLAAGGDSMRGNRHRNARRRSQSSRLSGEIGESAPVRPGGRSCVATAEASSQPRAETVVPIPVERRFPITRSGHPHRVSTGIRSCAANSTPGEPAHSSPDIRLATQAAWPGRRVSRCYTGAYAPTSAGTSCTAGGGPGFCSAAQAASTMS
jgi:hypothetical protein